VIPLVVTNVASYGVIPANVIVMRLPERSACSPLIPIAVMHRPGGAPLAAGPSLVINVSALPVVSGSTDGLVAKIVAPGQIAERNDVRSAERQDVPISFPFRRSLALVGQVGAGYLLRSLFS
jgi:hypothetical protein